MAESSFEVAGTGLNTSSMWKEVISNFNPNVGNTYQIPAECKELCFEIGWAQSNLHFSCILPITPDFQTTQAKAIGYSQSGLGTGELWLSLSGTTLTVVGKENIGYCSNLVYGR